MNVARQQLPGVLAKRIVLTGRVQGLGVRPAIARLAFQSAIAGSVTNTKEGVTIHLEGSTDSIDHFESALIASLPKDAIIDHQTSVWAEPQGCSRFTILPSNPSEPGSHTLPISLTTQVPADQVVCEACRCEITDSGNRRFNYPFTCCCDCGPRYSLLERMPYEREQTSMAAFSLCTHCQKEYIDPTDRRFHAQTLCCPDCGPTYWLRDQDNRQLAHRDRAIEYAVAALRRQEILALRGLGGYQLLVDACSQSAVERLRQRKRRPAKPFAVMVANLDEAGKLADVSPLERELLCSPAGPIVLCRLKPANCLANSVSQEFSTVGLMLPTTPLHYLLLKAYAGPLVCTSANQENSPLIYLPDQAIEQLNQIADVCLEHDRPIRRPMDDSVVREMAGRPVRMRIARGYAPLSLPLSQATPVIALGGHQKAAIALSNGAQAILGPHVGDLDCIATRQRYIEQQDELCRLYDVGSATLVCDQHPEYFTSRWAQARSTDVIQTQHHHAHIVAGMLENGWLDRQVLGVAFDGTGMGTDQTIWGGEFLIASTTAFQRVGHLHPFLLAGGQQAIRQPWRVAVALTREACGQAVAENLQFSSVDARPLQPLLNRPNLCLVTTSAGRLFDGVASLICGIEQCDFEGQAAMLLEAICDRTVQDEYPFTIYEGTPCTLDWRPMIRQLHQDRRSATAPSIMASRFHRGLARGIAKLCERFPEFPIVLGGGVFQNRYLVELLMEQLTAQGRIVGFCGEIPPNDGGLAAGQLAIASARIKERSRRPCA